MIPTRGRLELAKLAHAEQAALKENPYLIAPLQDVRRDALHGVALAKAAWRQRDPDGAAMELGRVVEPTCPPTHVAGVLRALGDSTAGRCRRPRRRHRPASGAVAQSSPRSVGRAGGEES